MYTNLIIYKHTYITYICIYDFFFIHSADERYLDSFCNFVIVSSETINMDAQLLL